MGKKIRVLQSMDTIGVGGTENFVINLYRNIDREQFQMDFLIFDDFKSEYKEEAEREGSKIFLCKSDKTGKISFFRDTIQRVKRVLEENQYDIIHINSVRWLGLMTSAIPAKRNGKIRIVTHSHGIGDPAGGIIDKLGRNYLKKYLSKVSDAGFACSELAGKNRFTEQFIASDKYYLVNNGITTEKYLFSEKHRREVRDAYHIPEDCFLLGTVGRLVPEKNQKFLIDILAEEPENKKLMIIGDGPLMQELEQYTKEKGVTEHVILTGGLMDAHRYYSAMDCFLLPSVFEGFPFVLVEAQVNGLPCIVSDNMSKEVNIAGGVDFLRLEDPPSKWVGKIRDSKKRLSEEQIQKTTELFDIRRIAKFAEGIYSSLAN